MSNREKCIEILDSLNENQLVHILTMLEAACNAINEAEDDKYCERLYKEYLDSKDKGESVSIQELSKQLGITL